MEDGQETVRLHPQISIISEVRIGAYSKMFKSMIYFFLRSSECWISIQNFQAGSLCFPANTGLSVVCKFGSKPAKSDSMIIITKLYPKSHISYLLWGWPLKYVQWKSILNISRFHILEIWFTVHKWLSLKCLMCKAMVFSTWMETLFIIVEGLLELRYISTPEIYTIMGNISLRMKQI